MYAATSNPTDRAREAAANRLWIPQTCRDGGLLGYGVDLRWCYWRAATHIVDKILKGTRPGDLPIEFPAGFWLAAYLGTVKPLGMQLPAILLTRADEVIE